jgi:hypothetical protein
MREGLDEEMLALFDLLKKPDLEKKDIERIKKVAVELLGILKGKKQEIDDWRAKEQTRDEMRQAINDFLYSDSTGLPESYEEAEVAAKTDAVFAHVYRMYAQREPWVIASGQILVPIRGRIGSNFPKPNRPFKFFGTKLQCESHPG